MSSTPQEDAYMIVLAYIQKVWDGRLPDLDEIEDPLRRFETKNQLGSIYNVLLVLSGLEGPYLPTAHNDFSGDRHAT